MDDANSTKADPFDTLLIACLPDWLVPVVQVVCLIACFFLSFVFIWIGQQGVASGIAPIAVWAAGACFIASYLFGLAFYKARITAALMQMFGKGIFRLLFRLLLSFIRKPNEELDKGLVEQVHDAMPGDEEAHLFFRAFQKAARAFWQTALLLGLLAATMTVLGGGGLLGGFTIAVACLAYGISLTCLARQGFLFLSDDSGP